MLRLSIIEYHLGLNTILKHRKRTKIAMEAEEGTAICALCVFTLPSTSAHYYKNSVLWYAPWLSVVPAI